MAPKRWDCPRFAKRSVVFQVGAGSEEYEVEGFAFDEPTPGLDVDVYGEWTEASGSTTGRDTATVRIEACSDMRLAADSDGAHGRLETARRLSHACVKSLHATSS